MVETTYLITLRKAIIVLLTFLTLFNCFKDFPVIEYTYVACFKVSMWFVHALCGLMVFMVY